MTTTDLATIEAWLARRLTGDLPGPAAQRRFAPTPPLPAWAPELRPDAARRAAALILLYASHDGVVVPLTVRHSTLPHHPGQISLPGGAIDPGESAEAAALREAEEEIGVSAQEIRILGPLSTLWVAVSNFVVQPFIGVTDSVPAFQLHPLEVEALIEVPLRDLRDPGRLRWAQSDGPSRSIRYPYFDAGGRIVWGATAMMLGEFVCLFEPDYAPPAQP